MIEILLIELKWIVFSLIIDNNCGKTNKSKHPKNQNKNPKNPKSKPRKMSDSFEIRFMR